VGSKEYAEATMNTVNELAVDNLFSIDKTVLEKICARRAQVFTLRQQGFTTREISRELRVSQQNLLTDIAWLDAYQITDPVQITPNKLLPQTPLPDELQAAVNKNTLPPHIQARVKAALIYQFYSNYWTIDDLARYFGLAKQTVSGYVYTKKNNSPYAGHQSKTELTIRFPTVSLRNPITREELSPTEQAELDAYVLQAVIDGHNNPAIIRSSPQDSLNTWLAIKTIRRDRELATNQALRLSYLKYEVEKNCYELYELARLINVSEPELFAILTSAEFQAAVPSPLPNFGAKNYAPSQQ
jgi:hypothetical protein